MLNAFQNLFDLKPSEFQSAIDQGYDRGIGLVFLANESIESRKTINAQKQIEASQKIGDL